MIEKITRWIVSPYVFVLGYIGYVVTGVLCFSFVSDAFTLHFKTFLFIGVGLTAYCIGCQFVLPDKKLLYFLLLMGFVIFYSYREYKIIGLVIPVITIVVLQTMEKVKKELLVIIGSLVLICDLIMRGIPLIDPVIRMNNISLLFIIGYFLLISGIAFLAKTWSTLRVIGLFVCALVLLFVFTYRVYILVLVIVVFVSLYMLKKVQLTHIIASVIPLFVLVLIIGYIGVIYQDWKYNLLELFLFRPAFTLGVLNDIVERTGYLGITHGKLWLDFTTTTIIGAYLFGYECNITSTIMGPLIFDGGIVELGIMAFFGAALNTLYKKALLDKEKVPYYTIVLAIFMGCIDVSFIPSIVLLFFAGLYMTSKDSTWKVKNRLLERVPTPKKIDNPGG